MKLGEMAAAMWLVAAAPAFAQQQPGADDFGPPKASDSAAPAPATAPAKSKKKAKASAPTTSTVATPGTPTSSPAPASTQLVPPPPPSKKSASSDDDVLGLKLETAHDTNFIELPDPNAKEFHLDQGLFDIKKAVDAKKPVKAKVCVYPFYRNGRASDQSTGVDEIQQIFANIARKSTLVGESVAVKTKAPDDCKMEDAVCLARLGNMLNPETTVDCDTVIVGHADHKSGGYVFNVSVVDVASQKAIASVDDIFATQSKDELNEDELKAFAEGKACAAMKVNCDTPVAIDADRKGMEIEIARKVIPRKPGVLPGAEQHTLTPGAYSLVAHIGDHFSSGDRRFIVRRGNPEVIYVRQTDDAAVYVFLASEHPRGWRPAASQEVKRGGVKPTKVVGIVAAGLGVIAEGVAIQQFEHSQSLANGAANNYTANGYYKPADLSAISSAKSAHTNSTVLTAVGAGLVVVGAVLFFAF